MGFHSIKTNGCCLVELGWLLPLVLLEEKGVDVILQLGVESMVIGARVIDIVFNASVYIGVAYGVTDIMADKTAHVGQAFFTLLPGADSGKLHETATEKVIDMVFMHIGTYIAVVSMAQDGQVIKKHVRPLETQLIEPPILGNDKLQIVLRHIIVCFHTQDIVCCKTWHRHTSFLLDSCSCSCFIFYHKQL